MKFLQLISVVLFISCSYRIKIPDETSYTMKDTICFKAVDRKGVVDSVILRAENKVLHKSKFIPLVSLPVSGLKPGSNSVTLSLKLKKGKQVVRTKDMFVVSDIIPAKYKLKLLKELPHDTSVFVQGLVMYKGLIYESGGLKGKSRLRIINPENGKCIRDRKTGPGLFNEGVAFVHDTLFMITWKDSVFLMFDENLNELGRKSFNSEGWGMFSHNDTLYISNGTNEIIKFDPVTGSFADTLRVVNDKGPVNYINEMEWVNGTIWVNIYGKDDIVMIDPVNGKVIAIISPENIIDRSRFPKAGVMNGIAYDKETNRVYLTGKNWPFIKVFSLIR